MSRLRWFLFTTGVLVVVVAMVAGATAWATAGRRTDDALMRLEDGAAALQECHELRGSYDGCESGEARVENYVADGAFTLRTKLFGVGTFAIRARSGGELVRTCEARIDRCAGGRWQR